MSGGRLVVVAVAVEGVVVSWGSAPVVAAAAVVAAAVEVVEVAELKGLLAAARRASWLQGLTARRESPACQAQQAVVAVAGEAEVARQPEGAAEVERQVAAVEVAAVEVGVGLWAAADWWEERVPQGPGELSVCWECRECLEAAAEVVVGVVGTGHSERVVEAREVGVAVGVAEAEARLRMGGLAAAPEVVEGLVEPGRVRHLETGVVAAAVVAVVVVALTCRGAAEVAGVAVVAAVVGVGVEWMVPEVEVQQVEAVPAPSGRTCQWGPLVAAGAGAAAVAASSRPPSAVAAGAAVVVAVVAVGVEGSQERQVAVMAAGCLKE
ncbi:hypothetical protein PLESTM_000074200 [Pleodorina starrii]|nr:hypothetical protein PLESTM_000074200 [Pleodorina starrii]